MSAKQRIHDTLVSWIEAHHVPCGYGGKARFPDPDATEGGPWGYLKTCLVDGSTYVHFLDNPMFERTRIRAIADLARVRVVALLPPGAALASAASTTPSFHTSDQAREAIANGAVVGFRKRATTAPRARRRDRRADGLLGHGARVRVGGANFAGGTAQYDLESGAFDGSC